MKCYLINLDRAPERMARMQNILLQHGIEFERVAAIDAGAFTETEIQQYRAETRPGKSLRIGDIACGASHLLVLRKIAEGADAYACVLEDDLHLADDITFFTRSTEWMPNGADIVKLETFNEKTIVDRRGTALPGGRSVVQLRGYHGGTAFYVISKHAASEIIQHFTAGMMCVDQFIFDEMLPRFNIYQVTPAPAVQDSIADFKTDEFLSSSIRCAPQKSTISGFPKLKRECLQVFNKALNTIDLIYRRLMKGQIRMKIPYTL